MNILGFVIDANGVDQLEPMGGISMVIAAFLNLAVDDPD